MGRVHLQLHHFEITVAEEHDDDGHVGPSVDEPTAIARHQRHLHHDVLRLPRRQHSAVEVSAFPRVLFVPEVGAVDGHTELALAGVLNLGTKHYVAYIKPSTGAALKPSTGDNTEGLCMSLSFHPSTDDSTGESLRPSTGDNT